MPKHIGTRTRTRTFAHRHKAARTRKAHIYAYCMRRFFLPLVFWAWCSIGHACSRGDSREQGGRHRQRHVCSQLQVASLAQVQVFPLQVCAFFVVTCKRARMFVLSFKSPHSQVHSTCSLFSSNLFPVKSQRSLRYRK